MNTQANERTDFNSGQSFQGQSEGSHEGSGLKEKSKETARVVKQKAREAGETVMNKGAEAAHNLKEQGKTYAQDRQGQLGERIHGYSSAVRRAADKLRDEKDPNIAHYADMVAERLDQVADYVQGRDLGRIMRDVENAARRRPEVFFGGMFVAGLALSRFFKASSDRYEYDAGDEDYWVEDEGYQEDQPLGIDSGAMDSTPPDLSISPTHVPGGVGSPGTPGWQSAGAPMGSESGTQSGVESGLESGSQSPGQSGSWEQKQNPINNL